MPKATIPTANATPLRGYIEGYYGRLLNWGDRLALLQTLDDLRMSVYLYAPKEDPCHRFRWRDAYAPAWRAAWRGFCEQAMQRSIGVVAGIAPGLDFDYRDLEGGDDFTSLVSKCTALLDDGAGHLCLLLDDIPEKLDAVSGLREGEAHARLANRLGEVLGQSLWVVPRVYADEIARDPHAYLDDFTATLDRAHTVVYSGAQIVARRVDRASLTATLGSTHPLIVWDNLYANDYCPRRLFAGPWQGRDAALSVLLNPTGLPRTDALLLALMSEGGHSPEGWWQVLTAHGVPPAFAAIARQCWHPVFSDGPSRPGPDAAMLESLYPGTLDEALEHLLWCWKGELSREWYGFLMGLKQDLLIATHRYSDTAIHKTQNPLLAGRLLRADDAAPAGVVRD